MGLREDVVAEIFGKPARVIKLGLDRMRLAAAEIGNPQDKLKIVHVAGTNGKGSVCTFVESIARAAGFKTGLYTSPHLIDFEERFLLDGRPVSSEAWLAVYEDIKPAILKHDLSFFEISTLIAFEIFKRAEVGIAVIETGLGGRLDATNIVNPAVSVITRIGLDHIEYLGNDLLSIAGEKLGIAKRGVPLVLSPQDDPAIEVKAEAVCAILASKLTIATVPEHLMSDKTKCVVSIPVGDSYAALSLVGDYQAANAAAAVCAAKIAFSASDEAILKGLARAFLPGRFQIVKRADCTFIFDVGHNSQAVATFAKTLRSRFRDERIAVVTGIMADKDHAAMMRIYSAVADVVICTTPPTPRAAPAELLASEIPQGMHELILVEPDIVDAMRIAAKAADVVCVCGSFFTVGSAMAALGFRPYGD